MQTHKYMAKSIEKLSTTNMASITLLLQIADQYDLLIQHKDVKSAYLNAPFDYEIYVEPPAVFKVKNGNHVWKLNNPYMRQNRAVELGIKHSLLI